MGSPSTWGLPAHLEQTHLAPCLRSSRRPVFGSVPQLVTHSFQVAMATDSQQPLPLARHLNRELRHTPLMRGFSRTSITPAGILKEGWRCMPQTQNYGSVTAPAFCSHAPTCRVF